MELHAAYGAVLRQRGYSEHTIRRRLMLLRDLGGLAMTADSCRALIDRPATPETRRQYQAQIRRLVADLLELGYLERDPMRGFLMPTKAQYRPRPLPEASIRALLALPGRLGHWSVCGYYGALRRLEIARLSPEQLHRGRDGWELTVIGKGDKRATIPAHARLVETVQGYPARRRCWPLTPDSITNTWNRAARDLLGERVTFHQLRHSGITAFYERSGCDLVTTARFARHARIETTMTYADAADWRLRRAVEAL